MQFDDWFESLDARRQKAFAVGLAARLFGPDQVTTFLRRQMPVIDDLAGQGHATEDDNFWEGVWKIHTVE